MAALGVMMRAGDLTPGDVGRVLVVADATVAPDGSTVVDQVSHPIDGVCIDAGRVFVLSEGVELSLGADEAVGLDVAPLPPGTVRPRPVVDYEACQVPDDAIGVRTDPDTGEAFALLAGDDGVVVEQEIIP